MNVGIDIDGVLFPWADVANEVLVKKFGIPDPGPHVHWLHLKETITGEQWKWLWSAEGQEVVFRKIGRVYPDAVYPFIEILRNPERRCHFVTHRDPRRTAQHTGAFLECWFGRHPWAGLHIVQNACQKHTLMHWDVFIDDKPDTVRSMLCHTNALVLAPARPWNTELADIICPRFLRYDDPGVLPEIIDGWKS